jgi:hypothetical protein
MTSKEREAMATAVVDVVKQVVDPLIARIAALEARPQQKWAGVHVEGVPYAEASLVTRAGSLWVATTATRTTPGAPGSDWVLIVKRGQAV